MRSRLKSFLCLVTVLVLMNGSMCASSEANLSGIRIRTFAVPRIKNVNVRREPSGSIRATIDKKDSVYIIDTVEKKGKTWCRVIVFMDGWYQAYIQADYLVPLHDLADDVIKIVGGEGLHRAVVVHHQHIVEIFVTIHLTVAHDSAFITG